MNPNEYLTRFFGELECLVDGHGTRQAVSTTRSGEVETRLGIGDWYRATKTKLEDDSIKAAQDVANAANILLQFSKFYCHPGREGGPPFGLVTAFVSSSFAHNSGYFRH
jgi:hypothetical protein